MADDNGKQAAAPLPKKEAKKQRKFKKGKKGKGASRVASSNVSKSPKKGSKSGASASLDRRIILRKLKVARQHYRGIAGEEDANMRWGSKKEIKRGAAVALAHLELIEAWLVYCISSPASGEAYIPVYGKRKLTSEEKNARKAAAAAANVAFEAQPSTDAVDAPAITAIITEISAFRSPEIPAEKYDALLSDAPLHEKAERILTMLEK